MARYPRAVIDPAELRAMWATSLSAAKIARALHTSTTHVVAKAEALGLPSKVRHAAWRVADPDPSGVKNPDGVVTANTDARGVVNFVGEMPVRVRCPACGGVAGSDPDAPLTWRALKQAATGGAPVCCPRGHAIPIVALPALHSA